MVAALEWITKKYIEPKVGAFFASVIVYAALIFTMFGISRILMRLLSKSKNTHIPIIGAPFNVKHSSF